VRGPGRRAADAAILARVELLTRRTMIVLLRSDAVLLARIEFLARRASIFVRRHSEAAVLARVELHARRAPGSLTRRDAAIYRGYERFARGAAELSRGSPGKTESRDEEQANRQSFSAHDHLRWIYGFRRSRCLSLGHTPRLGKL
jgi:hypothetical protein